MCFDFARAQCTALVQALSSSLLLCHLRALFRSVGKGYVLVIRCVLCFEDIYLGASISVNGICLTVTAFETEQKTVQFGIAPETINCTNILCLKPDSKVNLERAAKLNARNSGHYVQGHVDCTGVISKKWNVEESLFIEIKLLSSTGATKTTEGAVENNSEALDEADQKFEMLVTNIVTKGFIAIDGTSLTVCDTRLVAKREQGDVQGPDEKAFFFTFMLVHYTQNHVIIPHKKVGEQVNIEVDVMAKYMFNSVKHIKEEIEKKAELQLSKKFGEYEATIETLTARVAWLESKLET